MNPVHENLTSIERLLWVTFGIALAVYLIAGGFWLYEIQEYDPEPATAAGWMSIAQTTAMITFVPAAILTGIRQLIPTFLASKEQTPVD